MTRTAKIIVAGFLVRAFLGQALFWISWLRLPIASSLQIGDGFWFFAADGPEYLLMAKGGAGHGLWGILTSEARVSSHVFTRLVAICVMYLGPFASVAILINCAAYALTCAILVRLGKNDVLLAAIAFCPAAILFSTQLLKDTLFFLFIVLMVAIFRRWQELWRSGGTVRQFIACAAAMVAIVFALGGIRWYFAASVWGASAIFLALVIWTARHRGRALAVSVILFVLLAQAVRLGGRDMPPQIKQILNPTTTLQSKPTVVTKLAGTAQRGFDTTPAATTIVPGPSVEALPKFASRLVTGFSATFLPRFLAQSLGLIHIGGGRGFWLFAEVDTIVFDLVLLYVIVYCVRVLRSGTARATPLFVLCILVFVLTAGPMIFTVNNFGTLFRLRQMLYVIAVVTAITLRTREDEENDRVGSSIA
ncbi:MAG TPA: hypothetical protein VGQ76_09695 [Thermoanaerobaculia bacterium]|nr:hypothetical protein [Thermoanaerobaculia bacterium]